MRYISDDGKVFNTELECLEHENTEKKRLEEERIKKEEIKKKQKERYDSICKHHKELINEIHSYEKDYNSYIFTDSKYDGIMRFLSGLENIFS